MSKQNRGLMTTQTKQTTSDEVDYKHMIQEIANDYSEMYNASAHNPIKDILNQLLMFGEEEGVLVTTAIQKLYECNKEYKEGV
jgi:hypothetical protein